MSSQQSSFRDMFQYPLEGNDQKHRKYGMKGARSRKSPTGSSRPLKESFQSIVQKAKNVAKFAQTLKQKVAEKRTLNEHTLKANQMDFLQNDSQMETANIYFSHQNKKVLAFEAIFIVTMFLYLWNCTVQIVFGALIEQHAVQSIVLLVYAIHIVLFNLTQYKNQKFQSTSNRNQVYSIYINQKLLKDCTFLLMVAIQLTPLDNHASFSSLYIVVRVISLIGFFEMVQTWQKIQDEISVSNQAQTLISMFKLLFKIVFFLHHISIALNILAIVQAKSNIQQTWLTENDIKLDTILDKYIVGWYWGATILSTVGFGEITPKNNYERFFVSLIQVICCMSFGYFVNVVGELIKIKAEPQEKYQKQVRSLNRCLNFVSIAKDLKHKIRTFFFNRHVIQRIYDPNEEKQMLISLPPNLQNALLEQNNINILKKNEIMQKFKKQTLIKLTHIMKKIILAPENIIYSRMTKDRKLWLIEKGQIQEFTDNFENSTLKKLISTYNQNDSLVGWVNFLTQNGYKTMASAKIFTIAYEMQEQGFMNAMKEDTKEFHRFLNMKHMMIFKNRKFVNKCISCDRYTHNVIHCPRIHFVRKDIKKLAHQYRHLKKYIDEQAKAKKIDRHMIRYDWKGRYSTGQLERQSSIVMNNDVTSKIENGTIQNYLKNMMFRQSVLGFQKRKMSFMVTKRSSNILLTEPKEKEQKDSVVADVRSSFASDHVIQKQEQTLFDKVLVCEDENADYMPDHDVAKVLVAYANKYHKKLQLEDRVRKLVRR